MAQHSPAQVGLQQKRSIVRQGDVPPQGCEGRKCFVVSLAHQADALAPARKREPDEIALQQSRVLFGRAQRLRDRPVLDIDAAVESFVASKRTRLDSEAD